MTTQRTQKELEVVAYVLDKVYGENDAKNYLERRVLESSGEEKENWTQALSYQESLDRKNFVFRSQKESLPESQKQSESGAPPQVSSPTKSSLYVDKNERGNSLESDHADVPEGSQKEQRDTNLFVILGAVGVFIMVAILLRAAKGKSNRS